MHRGVFKKINRGHIIFGTFCIHIRGEDAPLTFPSPLRVNSNHRRLAAWDRFFFFWKNVRMILRAVTYVLVNNESHWTNGASNPALSHSAEFNVNWAVPDVDRQHPQFYGVCVAKKKCSAVADFFFFFFFLVYPSWYPFKFNCNVRGY